MRNTPRAGRDDGGRLPDGRTTVSIHAPRAGRDYLLCLLALLPRRFNPRAPCGARLTHPCEVVVVDVSIHAPRAGRDLLPHR